MSKIMQVMAEGAIGAIRELTITETEAVSGATVSGGRVSGPVHPSTIILLPPGYYFLITPQGV